VLRTRIQDPGSGVFLTPGSGIRDGYNPDHISESLETIFGSKLLKFFKADPGSGMGNNSDPVSKIRDGKKNRIRNPQFTVSHSVPLPVAPPKVVPAPKAGFWAPKAPPAAVCPNMPPVPPPAAPAAPKVGAALAAPKVGAVDPKALWPNIFFLCIHTPEVERCGSFF
jgi:hypothetical protein